MEVCLAVDQNREIEYILPEHLPNGPFFSVHYPCLCGKEVLVVPMTFSRYMARGLKDLSDPNEQHRNWALSSRLNKDHVYPEPHNNFTIHCGGHENREIDRNEDERNNNIRNDGDQGNYPEPRRPRRTEYSDDEFDSNSQGSEEYVNNATEL